MPPTSLRALTRPLLLTLLTLLLLLSVTTLSLKSTTLFYIQTSTEPIAIDITGHIFPPNLVITPAMLVIASSVISFICCVALLVVVVFFWPDKLRDSVCPSPAFPGSTYRMRELMTSEIANLRASQHNHRQIPLLHPLNPHPPPPLPHHHPLPRRTPLHPNNAHRIQPSPLITTRHITSHPKGMVRSTRSGSHRSRILVLLFQRV